MQNNNYVDVQLNIINGLAVQPFGVSRNSILPYLRSTTHFFVVFFFANTQNVGHQKIDSAEYPFSMASMRDSEPKKRNMTEIACDAHLTFILILHTSFI